MEEEEELGKEEEAARWRRYRKHRAAVMLQPPHTVSTVLLRHVRLKGKRRLRYFSVIEEETKTCSYFLVARFLSSASSLCSYIMFNYFPFSDTGGFLQD